LTAQNWYKGKNVVAAETALKEMIDAVLTNGSDKMHEIIGTAASKIQQTVD